MPKFRQFSPITPRPCVVLINYVHNDGIGDFKHLVDFSFYFHDLFSAKDIDIVCIVINGHMESDPQSHYIKETLDALPASHKVFVYDSVDGHEALRECINSKRTLKEQLQQARAIIDISLTCSYKLVVQEFTTRAIPTMTITQIDLHITLDQAASPFKIEIPPPYQPKHACIMGLGNGKDGLKLRKEMLNTPEKAQSALQQISDTRIIKHLLDIETIDQVSQESVKEFFNTNYFIPGYLQCTNTMFAFITLFANNNLLREEGKNIIFFFNNYKTEFTKKKFILDNDSTEIHSPFYMSLIEPYFPWHDAFASSDIKSITIYNYDNHPVLEVIELHDTGREITILTGIQLNDDDYQLLYDIPQHFVAASGDNTLENAINHGLLFLMQRRYQLQTVRAIAETALKMQEYFGFNEAEVRDFCTYFGEAHQLIAYTNQKAISVREALQCIDLVRLSLNMKKVCAYLVERENVLDKLPGILAAHLGMELEPPSPVSDQGFSL